MTDLLHNKPGNADNIVKKGSFSARPRHLFYTFVLVQLTFISSRRHSIAPLLHTLTQHPAPHNAGPMQTTDDGALPPRDICRIFWECIAAFIDYESFLIITFVITISILNHSEYD